MKKLLWSLISFCLVAAIFVLFAYLGNRDKISIFGEDTENKNTIYIGVYEPLTGDYAQGGLSEALGVRYANSVCPTVEIAGTTYNIKLVEVDNVSDEVGSAAAAKTLAKSKLSAVIGSYGAAATAAGSPVFANKGVPLIGVSCASQFATKDSSAYFRMCFTDSFQSGIMANLAKGMNLEHAVVLTQTGDAYSKAAGKTFSEAFLKLGGEVTELSFQLRQENFRALAKEILQSDADFVYMLSGSSEAKYFINQARSEGLVCPILGPETWDSALLLNEVTFTASDVYFASEFNSGEDADPVASEFAENFSSWVQRDSQRISDNGGNSYCSSSSALAYDSYMLLVAAISKANSSDPSAVLQELGTITYQGVTGSISIDEKGESEKKMAYIKTINLNLQQFEVLQISSAGD